MATAPPTPPRQSWQFGRIYTPDEAWLATAPPEPIIEPDLPIVDPHHHLWLRGGHPYLLDELLADLNTGHNVVATVFEECHSMYRVDGPPEMRAVGETEFVAGIAAMSASGNYGKTRVAAGIVGAADLTLGDRVEPVLLAQLRAGGEPPRMEALDERIGEVPECRRQARRHGQPRRRLRFPRRAGRTLVGNDGGGLAALYRDLHRAVRRQALHVREQLPGRQDGDR